MSSVEEMTYAEALRSPETELAWYDAHPGKFFAQNSSHVVNLRRECADRQNRLWLLRHDHLVSVGYADRCPCGQRAFEANSPCTMPKRDEHNHGNTSGFVGRLRKLLGM